MEKAGHAYTRIHPPLRGQVLRIDGKGELVALLDEARQQTHGRAAKTVLKEPLVRLTLLALTAGSYLTEHSAPGALVIEVRSGDVRVRTELGAETLKEGDLLSIEPGVKHEIVAISDATLMLFVAFDNEAG